MNLDEFKTALTEAGHEWGTDTVEPTHIRDERGFCPLCSLATDRGWDWKEEANEENGWDVNAYWDDAADYLDIYLSEASHVVVAADFVDPLSKDQAAIREWLEDLPRQGETA